jgi:hypothetical protein
MQDFHLSNRDGLDIHLANLLTAAETEPIEPSIGNDIFAMQHILGQDHVRNIDGFIRYFGEV